MLRGTDAVIDDSAKLAIILHRYRVHFPLQSREGAIFKLAKCSKSVLETASTVFQPFRLVNLDKSSV